MKIFESVSDNFFKTKNDLDSLTFRMTTLRNFNNFIYLQILVLVGKYVPLENSFIQFIFLHAYMSTYNERK